MVKCGATNCGNSSSKKKTCDVKGLHKVPTSDKPERMKWLHAMRRDAPYPSDKNFYIYGLHCEDDYFERDLKVRVITQSKVFLMIGVPKN